LVLSDAYFFLSGIKPTIAIAAIMAIVDDDAAKYISTGACAATDAGAAVGANDSSTFMAVSAHELQ